MSAQKNKKAEVKKTETTGHSWDGIEELNNPLPRWWLWTFYACCLFGVVWTILYPAWPLVNGATQGILGYDSRGVVEEEINAVNAQNAGFDEQMVALDYTQIVANEEVNSYANNGGAAIFRTYCSQCHGEGAAGAVGYPNLNDDDWLWGGTFADIDYTLRHGINADSDDETRISEMTPFQGIFNEEELHTLIGYVQSLSGEDHEAVDLALGENLFSENCASCHGENAMGDREQGAPNLTDAIWLYGSDYDTIREGILNGRKNVMPQWSEILDESQLKQVVTYVHGLGGGE